METSPIIPELDVPRNVLSCFSYGRVHGAVDPLDFHRSIERFGESIIETLTGQYCWNCLLAG